MDRSNTNRGGNYNFGDIDEVQLLKRDVVEQVLIPSVRGGQDQFGSTNPFNGMVRMFGSMPWLDHGQWVLDYEQLAITNPELFAFLEATPHCNVKMLGPDWIRLQQMTLSPEVFAVEIMNQRKMRAENQFYFNFDDEKHTYAPRIVYRDDPDGRVILADKNDDYREDQLIDLAWDFGGWFTCCLCFQSTHEAKDMTIPIERMIDSFFVHKGHSADDVVDQFCDRYRNHKFKFVRLYGEPRANDPTAFGLTLYQKVRQRFESRGWKTELRVFQSQAHSHDQRYTYINELLSETTRGPRLRINQDTCKGPIMAIKFAGRTYDLKKDKSKEKDRKMDQQLTTHYTDALDYYFMQKHYRKVMGLGMSAGVM